MAHENYYYVTAGLQKTKDSTNDPPTANHNTYYITAGLPKVCEVAESVTVTPTVLTVTASLVGTPPIVNRTMAISH